MIPFIQKEPAAVAGAVIAVLNVLQLLSVVNLDGDALAAINTALVAVLTLFVRSSSTSIASPTLKTGTEVSVQDSDDTVVIAPTPPGPQGIEGGVEGVG